MVKLDQQDQKELEKAKDLLGDEAVGELGFIKSACFGRLRLDQVIPYPRQDPEEKRRTDELLERLDRFLGEHVDPDRIDEEQRIGQEVIDGLGVLGVLGMTVPRAYGGGGFSHTAYCRVLERVSRTCASTAVMIGAHQSIGLKALVLCGTEEQKRRWLPDLAAGRELAAFCLTEPEAGSDAANVRTEARLSDDGRHWIINGEKKFATNAAMAGFMTVMARTPVRDNGEMKDRLTAFIVTPDLPGFAVVSPNRAKCGIRGSWQGTLRFEDMRVPADRILGELGRGLRVALTVLDYGRCTLSAGCVGGAKHALAMAVRRARERRQFGRSIGEFQLIKRKIARMAELTFAMDALTYLAAGLVDRHAEDIMLETAVSKLFCSEASWRVIDDAVQVWGGEGYMRETGLERMLRDARINRIVEGTTEVMTSFVALMGMRGVGEELEQVLSAARHPIRNIGRLADFARHEWRDLVVGHASNGAMEKLDGRLRSEGRMLARLTRRLARQIGRVLAKHREKIIKQQLVQQRVAWAVVELYAMAAVLSRMQAMIEEAEAGGPAPGHDPPSAEGQAESLQRDLAVGRSYCRHAADRISRRLNGLFRNRDDQTLAAADAVLGFTTTDAAGENGRT